MKINDTDRLDFLEKHLADVESDLYSVGGSKAWFAIRYSDIEDSFGDSLREAIDNAILSTKKGDKNVQTDIREEVDDTGKETCEWKHDMLNYYWPSCLGFDEDNAAEKCDDYKYCPYCGKSIVEV